jgi:hypothetical protein
MLSIRGMTIRIRHNLLVTVLRGLDRCKYGVYRLLILRNQPVVHNLKLICPVATSGYNYLTRFRQGGLNPLIPDMIELDLAVYPKSYSWYYNIGKYNL